MIKAMFDTLVIQHWPRVALLAVQLAIAVLMVCWSIVFWPFGKSRDQPNAADPDSPDVSMPADADLTSDKARSIVREIRRAVQDEKVDPAWREKVFDLVMMDDPVADDQQDGNDARAAPEQSQNWKIKAG